MRKSQPRSGHRRLKLGAAVAVATAAVLAAPAVPAYAATFSVATTQVAVAGGTFFYLTGGTAFADTLGIRFAPSSGSCPSNYNTALTGTVDGGLIKAVTTAIARVVTPAMAAGTYKPCLYQNATSGGAYATDTTTDTVSAVNMGTLSAVTGKATDKITLTAASAIFTGTTFATEFMSGVTACPSTYTATSASVIASATTTKTSTSVLTITVPTVVVGTPYLICTYLSSTVGTGALTVRSKRTFAAFDPTLPAVTLAPTGGSSATATTVTVSTTDPTFNGTPAALVSYNSCPTSYAAGTSVEPYAATTTKISTSKLAVTMPTSVIVSSADVTTPWNVCIYASTSGALVTAPTIYSVAPVLSVTGAQFAVGSGSAASTGSGPAQGGSSITISGLTGIPTTAGSTLTASLGGSPIDNLTRIDATSFSGKTTAHAPGTANLSVTTAAGTKSTSTAPYTYTYGITIQPNTGSSGSQPVLDIAGAGFSTLTFGAIADGVALDSDPSDGNTAYVLLTDNTWNSQTFNGIDALATKSVSYCNTVLPISDSEIICTLHLEKKVASVTTNTPTLASAGDATDYVPNGTYTVTVVNAGAGLDATAYNYSIVSSGSTFTVSGY